jgi:hypothetical protein
MLPIIFGFIFRSSFLEVRKSFAGISRLLDINDSSRKIVPVQLTLEPKSSTGLLSIKHMFWYNRSTDDYL